MALLSMLYYVYLALSVECTACGDGGSVHVPHVGLVLPSLVRLKSST